MAQNLEIDKIDSTDLKILALSIGTKNWWVLEFSNTHQFFVKNKTSLLSV